MSRLRSQTATVLLAALVVFVGSALGAYAANGGPLLLGHSNKATATTKLKNKGSGPALSLKTGPTSPPLAVSNATKVTHLNADLVDGLDGAALQNRSYVYSLSATVANNQTNALFTFPGLPAGRYLVDYAVTMESPSTVSRFACEFVDTLPSTIQLDVAFGDTNGNNEWFANGSGYLDTTAGSRPLLCATMGATTPGYAVPEGPDNPAQVTFTRLDSVTGAVSVGTGS